MVADMYVVRDRARFVAAMALTWHLAAIGVVSVISCDWNAASEHAGMPECPLHQSAPACPVHGDKHGTHECDCPTIGCSRADAGIMAIFGTIGILPASVDVPSLVAAGDRLTDCAESTNSQARNPLAPPPRA